jgi:hypothetical protein
LASQPKLTSPPAMGLHYAIGPLMPHCIREHLCFASQDKTDQNQNRLLIHGNVSSAYATHSKQPTASTILWATGRKEGSNRCGTPLSIPTPTLCTAGSMDQYGSMLDEAETSTNLFEHHDTAPSPSTASQCLVVFSQVYSLPVGMHPSPVFNSRHHHT